MPVHIDIFYQDIRFAQTFHGDTGTDFRNLLNDFQDADYLTSGLPFLEMVKLNGFDFGKDMGVGAGETANVLDIYVLGLQFYVLFCLQIDGCIVG